MAFRRFRIYTRLRPTGRKICFGNRSAHGELATSRLLTVAETCDLQRLNILAYLSAAIVCHRNRKQAASLLHR